RQQRPLAEAALLPAYFAAAEIEAGQPGLVEAVNLLAPEHAAGVVVAQTVGLIHGSCLELASVCHDLQERTPLTVSRRDEDIVAPDQRRGRIDPVIGFPGKPPENLARRRSHAHQRRAHEAEKLTNARHGREDRRTVTGWIVAALPDQTAVARVECRQR